jgi:hypothetical protein
MAMSVLPRAKQAEEKAETPPPDWWEYLQRARAELEASGATFTPGEEIRHYVEQLRGETDRVEAVYWEANWKKHHGDSA